MKNSTRRVMGRVSLGGSTFCAILFLGVLLEKGIEFDRNTSVLFFILMLLMSCATWLAYADQEG